MLTWGAARCRRLLSAQLKAAKLAQQKRHVDSLVKLLVRYRKVRTRLLLSRSSSLGVAQRIFTHLANARNWPHQAPPGLTLIVEGSSRAYTECG